MRVKVEIKKRAQAQQIKHIQPESTNIDSQLKQSISSGPVSFHGNYS